MREGCEFARLWADTMAPLFCYTTWDGKCAPNLLRRWFAAAPSSELRKCYARGMRIRAPVGGYYGASILPYNLDGTEARQHQKFKKARAFANHTRFHLVFLRELRFFVPGTGEHILGEALMENHDARNARRICCADGLQQHQAAS